MELTNDFEVKAPIDRTWAVLTDVERIAPCLPGAQLQEVEGDTYRGVVKVKLGPISSQFKGEAHFVERDDAAYRAVIKGAERDTGHQQGGCGYHQRDPLHGSIVAGARRRCAATRCYPRRRFPHRMTRRSRGQADSSQPLRPPPRWPGAQPDQEVVRR